MADFSRFDHLLVGITLGAPVPKSTLSLTLETLKSGETLPELEKNPHNLNKEAYSRINDKFRDGRKTTLLRDKEGNVAGAITIENDSYITAVLGSGVDVSLTNGNLAVLQAPKEGNIPLIAKELNYVMVSGPTSGKGAGIVTMEPLDEKNVQIILERGNIDLSVSEKTNVNFVVSDPSFVEPSPLKVDIQAKGKVLAAGKVKAVTPLKDVAPGRLDIDSGKMEFSLGEGSFLVSAVKRTNNPVATLVNTGFNVSMSATDDKQKKPVSLFQDGIMAVKETKELEKSLDSMKSNDAPMPPMPKKVIER